jgi:hypothetical protein
MQTLNIFQGTINLNKHMKGWLEMEMEDEGKKKVKQN